MNNPKPMTREELHAEIAKQDNRYGKEKMLNELFDWFCNMTAPQIIDPPPLSKAHAAMARLAGYVEGRDFVEVKPMPQPVRPIRNVTQHVAKKGQTKKRSKRK